MQIMLGDQHVTPEMEQTLRKDMGLDLPIQERFFRFLYNASRGNFGRSFFHRRPVMEVILERLPATIELTLCAMLIAIIVSIPLGVLAAVKKGTIYDRIFCRNGNGGRFHAWILVWDYSDNSVFHQSPLAAGVRPIHFFPERAFGDRDVID